MTFALARSLLLADAVTQDALGQALLLSATRGASLVRALLATHAIEPPRLEQHLEKGDAPMMRHVAPVMSLVQRLPPGLCERLLALPVRHDTRTGTIDVAVVDARDEHAAQEIGYWLKAPVRVVRTSLASMEAGLARIEDRPHEGMRALAAPIGGTLPTVTEAAPAEPGTRPNIPIPLTRRSLAPVAVGPLGPPAVERDVRAHADARRKTPEPVLDLKRRKPGSAPASEPGGPTSRPPVTVRGPFSPAAPVVTAAPAPPPPPAPSPAPQAAEAVDVKTAVDKMRRAATRDEIFDLLVSGVRMVAARVTVLAVRRDALVGWACSPEVGDAATFRQLRIPTTPPTVLSEALEQGGTWLASLPRDPAHAPLLDALRQSPWDVLAVAGVRVEGRPAAAVVAAGLGEHALAKTTMTELSLVAGDALARLLRERRK